MERKKEQYMTSRRVVIPLAVLCTVLWGSAYPGIKFSYEFFGISNNDIANTMLLAGCRFFLAGFLCISFLYITQRRIIFPKKENVTGIVLTGLVQTGIQYVLFYVGVAHTTGVKGAILGATTTFWSILLSHFMFRNDKLNGNKIVGCLVGFAGIVIINLKGAEELAGFTLLGEGALLLSSASSALGTLISKKVASKENPVIIAGFQMMTGGLILLTAGMCMGGRLDFSSWKADVLLLYMAFLSAVAFSVWTLLHKYNEAGKIAFYNLLIPIFGSVMSAFFLGESIWNVKIFVALLCVCSGIFLANKK